MPWRSRGTACNRKEANTALENRIRVCQEKIMNLNGIEQLIVTLVGPALALPVINGKSPEEEAQAFWSRNPQLLQDLAVLYPLIQKVLPTQLGGTLTVS